MFKTFIAACLMAATASASGGDVAYNYAKLGSDWGSLKDTDGKKPYHTCDDGERQSPINLADGHGVGSSKIMIDLNDKYEDYESIEMSKVGGKFQVNLGPTKKELGTGTMDLTREDEESDWNPLQFHFHSPSEHTIMGKHMDLEMHLVHLTPDAELGAVLGIMFDVEEGGDGTNMFLSQMSGLATQDTITGPLSLKGFLQTLNLDEFWSYDGSLTTPPCTEGVRWSVLKTVQPISAAQLKVFSDVWKSNPTWAADNGGEGNNRGIQNLNSRPFYFSDFEENQFRVATIVLAVFLTLISITLISVVVSICVCPKLFGLSKAAAAK